MATLGRPERRRNAASSQETLGELRQTLVAVLLGAREYARTYGRSRARPIDTGGFSASP